MNASLGKLKDAEVVGKVLSCIGPVGVSHIGSWGGKAFELSRRDGNSRQLSIALLHSLSYRWLPTLRYKFCTVGLFQTDQSQWSGFRRAPEVFRQSTFFLAL